MIQFLLLFNSKSANDVAVMDSLIMWSIFCLISNELYARQADSCCWSTCIYSLVIRYSAGWSILFFFANLFNDEMTFCTNLHIHIPFGFSDLYRIYSEVKRNIHLYIFNEIRSTFDNCVNFSHFFFYYYRTACNKKKPYSSLYNFDYVSILRIAVEAHNRLK